MTSVLNQGEALGEFEILQVAGIGGMGVVYRARQRSLDRVVALKVIRDEVAEASEYRERFLREVHLAASVDHPNIVSVYDFGDYDGRLTLAMQWVQGDELRTILRSYGGLAPERAVQVLAQLGGALDAIHSVAGLVHRDVKPSNVLIREVGGTDHAYLTDFGIAKRSDTVADLTATGMVVGTVDYMAPEQITGSPTDARTDIYALGCVFYEMLTGRVPYQRDNSVAKLFAHVSDPPPRLEGAVAQRYPAFGPVLDKAMAKSPADRYLSAGDFARDATAALRGMRYMGAPTVVAVGDAKPSAATQLGPGEIPTLPDPARLEALRRNLDNERAHGPAASETSTTYPQPTSAAPEARQPTARTHDPTAVGPPTPLGPAGGQTPPPAYQGYGAPPAPSPSRGNSLALVLLALVAVAGIAAVLLAAAGVFSHQTPVRTITAASRRPSPHGGSSRKNHSPSRATTTPAATSTPSQPSTPTYNGQAFSISYPSGWQVQDAEQSRGTFTDTTIVSPSASNALVRVDYSRNPPSSPMASARPVINVLQRSDGYRQLALTSGTFDGNPALVWKFLVIESGVLLQKEDVFFNANGGSLGFAVLTQAPADEYAGLAQQFAQVRQSLLVK